MVFRKDQSFKREVFAREYPKQSTGHSKSILSIDISNDGQFLASAGKDQIIKVWYVRTKELYHNFVGHKKPITCVLFQFDTFELCSGSADGQMIFWNVEQKGKIQTVFGHKYQVMSMSNLNKKQIVSTSYDRRPILWNTEQSKQLLFDAQYRSLDNVVSVNQHCFVTGGEQGEICIYSKAKKRPAKSFNMSQHGWITSIDALYNGDILVSGHTDGTINIFKGSF